MTFLIKKIRPKIVKNPNNIIRLVKSKSPKLTTPVVIRNLLDSSKPRRKYTEKPYKGICEISLGKFCRRSRNQRYGIIHSNRKGTRDKVVKRAKEAMKKKNFKYNLLFEHCEHFANYCRIGRKGF